MELDFLLHILLDFSLAFVVAFCWGVLFGTPRQILWIAGLLGGLAHAMRFVMLQFEIGLILATLIASVSVGLIGIFCSHKVYHPSVVFTMPACITMIPGLYAYRTMLGSIKLTDTSAVGEDVQLIFDISHNLMLTMSLLFTLAIGISIAALLFRSKSVPETTIKNKRRRL